MNGAMNYHSTIPTNIQQWIECVNAIDRLDRLSAGWNRLRVYFRHSISASESNYSSINNAASFTYSLSSFFHENVEIYIETETPAQFWRAYQSRAWTVRNWSDGAGCRIHIGLRLPLATLDPSIRTELLGKSGFSQEGFLWCQKQEEQPCPSPFVTFYCPEWLVNRRIDDDGVPTFGMDLLDESNTLFMEAEQNQFGHPWKDSMCAQLAGVYFSVDDVVTASTAGRPHMHEFHFQRMHPLESMLWYRYKTFLANQARILGIPVIDKL